MRTQLFITLRPQNHQSKLLLACLLLFSCFIVLHTDAKPTVPPVRVACVGNSITYGTGIANRDKDSYPAQLQAMLGNKYLVGNFGKPGATLLRHGHRPYFKQQEFRDAMAFHADIAVIHLGINDTDPRNWPNYRDEFVTDYLALIDSLVKPIQRCASFWQDCHLLHTDIRVLSQERNNGTSRYRQALKLWQQSVAVS